MCMAWGHVVGAHELCRHIIHVVTHETNLISGVNDEKVSKIIQSIKFLFFKTKIDQSDSCGFTHQLRVIT